MRKTAPITARLTMLSTTIRHSFRNLRISTMVPKLVTVTSMPKVLVMVSRPVSARLVLGIRPTLKPMV